MPTTTYYPLVPTAPRPNIDIVINVAKATQVLSVIDKYRNKAFRGGTKVPDNKLYMLLCATAEILEWHNLYAPDADNIELMTNYVWSLVGEYESRALAALGNGTGIIIDPLTGSPINLLGYRSDFTIGDPGSLMDDGESVVTIPLPGFILGTVNMFPGINLTIGDATQFSISSILYKPTFVTITLNQGVTTGQRYIIEGLRATSGTTGSGSGGSGFIIPPLQKGQFLSNDGTNLIWDEPTIKITSTSTGWQPDGITYLDSRLANHQIDIRWEDVPVLLDPATQYTTITGGGFTINIPGFDVNTNSYTLTISQKGF